MIRVLHVVAVTGLEEVDGSALKSAVRGVTVSGDIVVFAMRGCGDGPPMCVAPGFEVREYADAELFVMLTKARGFL